MNKFKEKHEEIINEVIRRVEVCPQDYSAWSKVIDMLPAYKMRIILKTLIDYGKSIPIRTVERLIISVFRDKINEEKINDIRQNTEKAVVSPPVEPPSESAQQRAAQLWCLPETEKIEMIPELCIEIARMIDKYQEALIWCSASDDFAYPDGKAREGYEKIVKPLIK